MASILAALNAALGAIAGASKALASFFGWKSQKDLIAAGKATANAEALQQKDKADAKALAAREAVRGDIAREPDSVMQPDEFQRRD
jgi:hypothetical protein